MVYLEMILLIYMRAFDKENVMKTRTHFLALCFVVEATQFLNPKLTYSQSSKSLTWSCKDLHTLSRFIGVTRKDD